MGNGTENVLDRVYSLMYPDLAHWLFFLLLLDAVAMQAHLMGVTHFSYDHLLALYLNGLQNGVQTLFDLATLHSNGSKENDLNDKCEI